MKKFIKNMDVNIADAITHLSILGLVAVIANYFRGLSKDGKDAKILIEKHINICNEIPKSLIIEKLENLCEKQDLYQETNNAEFKKIGQSITTLDKRIFDLK